MTMLSLRNRTSRRVWAAIGLVFFLALQLLTASEPLHKLIHSDADSAGHHCAVTLLAQGQVDALESSLPLVAFIAALFFFLPPLQSAVFSSFEYRLAPSRGPPRS